MGIPGESEYIGRGVALCTHSDGTFFKVKRVIVVGGGNSGIEATLDLSGLATSVTVIEYTPELKADAMRVEKAKLVPNIDILSNTRVIKIIGNGTKVNSIRYENRDTTTTTEVPIDGVFIQIGLVPNSHLVKD